MQRYQLLIKMEENISIGKQQCHYHLEIIMGYTLYKIA